MDLFIYNSGPQKVLEIKRKKNAEISNKMFRPTLPAKKRVRRSIWIDALGDLTCPISRKEPLPVTHVTMLS